MKNFHVQAVTASRLFLAVGVAVLTLWSGEMWALYVSLALMGLAELSDLLDGMLARSLKAVTSFGKMFDPFCDSISRLIIFWALAVMDRTWAFVPLVMAVRDVTVAYCRVNLAGVGRDVSARVSGKVKAWIQGLGGFALMAIPLYPEGWENPVKWVASIAVLAITLYSMVDYILGAVGAVKNRA